MYLYAGGMAEGLRARLQSTKHEDRELGASALEWAIIAAISVVIATVIGTVVYNVVTSKGKDITNCANQPVGTNCAPGGGAPAT
jgi:Flp pilus assembly pilin Flp